MGELLAAAQERFDRVTDTRADRWAFRYLESSRRLGQIPPAMSPTESHKLAEEQADLLVGVIWAVLDGLGLSVEDWEKGSLLAEKAPARGRRGRLVTAVSERPYGEMVGSGRRLPRLATGVEQPKVARW